MQFIESEKIELKSKVNDSLEKEIVAFLNYKEGGDIYIGVSDIGGEILGLDNIDKEQQNVINRIRDKILPTTLGLFDVKIEKYDDRNIIHIIISSGAEKPYYIKQYGMSPKGCYIRVGATTQPMTQNMIDEMYAKRTKVSLRKIESNRQQLTFEQLKIYYEAKGKLLNDKFLENLDLLTPDGKLNYVAYLLADENGASIKVAKYNGIDKYDLIERNEYGYCSLVKATKSVLDKLEVENSTFTKITSKERIEQRLVDPTALREAVINAIVHNDYSKEVTPVFEIFTDRIEITSYGGLVEGLSREDFLSCRSMCRNRELMRVFQDLELVEQLGSGMTRILKKYDESIFKFTDNFLTVVFKFPNVSDFIIRNGFEKDFIKLPENMNKDYKNVGINIGINVGINYTGLEKKILNEMKNNPFISAESMAEKLGKSSRTIERAIGELKNKNIIRRIGANKNGYWEIIG